VKFLHAADVHLDSPLRGLERYEGAPVAELRGATRRAFDNLVDLAIAESVSFVLLAGDLYDGDWKDYNTGLYFVQRMARLREAGIRVFIVAGNHDAASQITRNLHPPENVTRFPAGKPGRVVVDDLGVAIHGQSFPTRAVTADLSQDYPRGDPQLFNIGLLHTCLDGKPGHEPYAPCHLEGLRGKGYQYWALGHVHAREEVSRNPWIVFPGNTQGRHIREAGPKGCALVTVEDGEVTALEHRDLDVLRWSLCTVDTTGCGNADQVVERVLDACRQTLAGGAGRAVAARLVLRGASPVHAQLHARIGHWVQEFRALAAGLGGAGLWLEQVVLDARRPIDAGELLARDDALGGLLRAIRAAEPGETALSELTAELSALHQRLPPELQGGGGSDPTDPACLRALLEDIRELLVSRLLGQSGA
jgi:exonuclease SbcD